MRKTIDGKYYTGLVRTGHQVQGPQAVKSVTMHCAKMVPEVALFMLYIHVILQIAFPYFKHTIVCVGKKCKQKISWEWQKFYLIPQSYQILCCMIQALLSCTMVTRPLSTRHLTDTVHTISSASRCCTPFAFLYFVGSGPVSWLEVRQQAMCISTPSTTSSLKPSESWESSYMTKILKCGHLVGQRWFRSGLAELLCAEMATGL